MTFPRFSIILEKNLSLANARRVKKTHTEAVRSIASFFSDDQVEAWTKGKPEDVIALNKKAHGFYTARIENNLAGYAVFLHPGYLFHFYIHPSYQRRGVGAAFLRYLEGMPENRNAKGCIGLKANETAIPFYRKQGYGQIGTDVLNFQGVSLPVAVMEKRL